MLSVILTLNFVWKVSVKIDISAIYNNEMRKKYFVLCLLTYSYECFVKEL